MGACHRKQDTTHKTLHEFLIFTDNYDKIPIVALEQAVIPLIPILPTIQTYVRMAKVKSENPADGLTPDESASIMLYSMGWQPSTECLYVVLNATLRSLNRKKFQPWFLYLKLLFTAVIRLPSIYSTVYRGNKSDFSQQYQKDENFTWWDVSLCTTSIDYLQSEKCLNKIGTRTIFSIECNSVKDISKHTYCQSDNSVLILPGTQFKVIECLNQDNDLHLITLREVQSSFFLETSFIKSKNLSRNNSSHAKQFKNSLISQISLISTNTYRNTSLEQLITQNDRGWTIDLDEQNITDQDMNIVVKCAINKKRCKRIRLRDNHITSHGAAILAKALINNMTLESLDLRNNHISDLGVQSLALAIINSNLKTLNLESNGITADGAQYLAQMLKSNRTLTELYLSKNQLGDRGVELLTNALTDDKKHHQDQENKGVCTIDLPTLQHLYLGQNDITDVGIEHLAEMLKTNRLLTWLWLSGNEIGNRGVELLSDTLANYNLSLEWLFLNSNKSISDPSVDILIEMLKRNHSLKTIYINNCNISETAKLKLREVTISKKDFDLEV